jgi:hypothetical protein
MIPARTQLRLWEAAERATGFSHLALTAAAQADVSKLGLYGYLFATAATLREALRAGLEFTHLVSTCSQLRIEAEDDREITYSCRHIGPGGRGADLGLQFCVGSFCTLASQATERAVRPARVEFAQPAPPSHGAFTEMLGTGRVDFGAPVTTFTFTASDLDSPMRAADPVPGSGRIEWTPLGHFRWRRGVTTHTFGKSGSFFRTDARALQDMAGPPAVGGALAGPCRRARNGLGCG